MRGASQPIELEGCFAEGVLGIFKIIRGFADLRDLADVSVPFDLSTFKYVPTSQAAEIPIKIRTEIIAILRDAGTPIRRDV